MEGLAGWSSSHINRCIIYIYIYKYIFNYTTGQRFSCTRERVKLGLVYSFWQLSSLSGLRLKSAEEPVFQSRSQSQSTSLCLLWICSEGAKTGETLGVCLLWCGLKLSIHSELVNSLILQHPYKMTSPLGLSKLTP